MQDNDFVDPLAVIDEAESLWPHNSHAVEDHGIEMAVLGALDKPADGVPADKPILRRAGSHSSNVRSLFSAIFGKALEWSSFDFFRAPCDRCAADVQPRHTLLVPVGRTTVEVHVCQRCREQLDSRLSGLVWS